jgi:hypothetical protein
MGNLAMQMGWTNAFLFCFLSLSFVSCGSNLILGSRNCLQEKNLLFQRNPLEKLSDEERHSEWQKRETHERDQKSSRERDRAEEKMQEEDPRFQRSIAQTKTYAILSDAFIQLQHKDLCSELERQGVAVDSLTSLSITTFFSWDDVLLGLIPGFSPRTVELESTTFKIDEFSE